MKTASALESISIPRGRLDGVAGERLIAESEEAFRVGKHGVVIDLSRVTAIDSQGISALAAVSRRVPRGARAVLCALGPKVEETARVTHLQQLFAIYPSVDAAVDALLD